VHARGRRLHPGRGQRRLDPPELTRADITGIWSGLRPLLAPEQKGASSERTADLSRRHTVRTSDGGLVTVTGGKLTTYRKMAEDTVDVAVVVARAARGCAAARRTCACTGHRRVAGWPPEGRWGRRQRALRPAHPEASRAAHLAGRYGTEAPAVLAMAEGRPELLEPLVEGLPYLAVEALWAVRREMAGSVSDVLDRRTQSAYRDARAAADAAPGWPP
jgi:glycerol-3-phosphate dehydrogenase